MTFTLKKVVNNYIDFGINLWPCNYGKDFASVNSSFRSDKLAKNAHPDKYRYSGYGIGFDERGSFSLQDGSGIGKNVIILGADMSSSMHIDNNEKDNGTNSCIFGNPVEIYQFKSKKSEINAAPLRLGNVSKDFSIDKMQKTKLYEYTYDFSDDFDSMYVAGIFDIQKYLMVMDNIR